MGRRGGEVSHSSAFSWHWQVRHQQRAGATRAYMVAPGRYSVPCGDGIKAQPRRGLRRAVRTRAAPYTSPSLTLVCLLQAGVRPSAFPAPRAFQDPATRETETQKQPEQRLHDRTVRLLYLLIPNSCQDPPN